MLEDMGQNIKKGRRKDTSFSDSRFQGSDQVWKTESYEGEEMWREIWEIGEVRRRKAFHSFPNVELGQAIKFYIFFS